MAVNIDNDTKLGIVFGCNLGCQDIQQPLSIVVDSGTSCLANKKYAVHWVVVKVRPHFDNVLIILRGPTRITQPCKQFILARVQP